MHFSHSANNLPLAGAFQEVGYVNRIGNGAGWACDSLFTKNFIIECQYQNVVYPDSASEHILFFRSFEAVDPKK